MKKILIAVALFGMSVSAVTAEEASGNLPATKPSNLRLNQEVPIGGIMMWWGARSYVNIHDMPNWQICNGDPVRPGSQLLSLGITNVPNLEDKFAKGAASTIVACPTVPQGAGKNVLSGLKTVGVPLSKEQLPSHFHDVSEAIQKHTHDTNTDYLWGPGGGGGLRMIMEPYADHTGRWPLHAGRGGKQPMPMGEVPYGLVGTTRLVGTDHISGSTGGGVPLELPLPDLNIKPEYVNVFYLIRVN